MYLSKTLKTKKLLNDLGFNIDDQKSDHEEFQIVRDNRGYISRQQTIQTYQ